MTRDEPVALTCGDPAGVGPELAVKAWAALHNQLSFFLIGDPAHLPANSPHIVIDDPAETAGAMAQGLPVLNHRYDGATRPGQPDLSDAKHTISAIARGVDLVTSGQASALCTNPINKKILKDGAGFEHPGHTEYLAALAGVDRVVMMLASDELRVVPTTIHIAVADVPGALTPNLLRETLSITHQALMTDFGIAAPRIAVAGLNPHAGEGGVMGREEIDLISPVIREFQDQGLAVTGPHSADTLFHAAARRNYDAAVCMYHDQALIPIKTLAFDTGVNVTLGLPFVRTSPDHGTAFDIAGQGIANPSSLIAALTCADDMARARG